MDLEEIVKKRKEQAIDREIFKKGSAVAMELGRKAFGRGRVFKDKPLKVQRWHPDLEDCRVRIEYDGETVFMGVDGSWGDNKVKVYKPGDWEETLETHYGAAQEQILERQWRSKNAKHAKMIEDFGIEYEAPIKEQ